MLETVKQYYSENYRKYGVSPKSLGWIKGKQNIRFRELTKRFDLSQPFSVLDLGCGFGDINRFFSENGIKDYDYTGIDIMSEFIDAACEIYKDRERIRFICGDFCNTQINEKYDYIIGSGIFNVNLKDEDNYSMVKNVMLKALQQCKENGAVSFDFQSDKVDFRSDSEYAFYYSPERILDMAYEYSRNVVLDNSYFPFEFSVTVFKNDSFGRDNLIFQRYEQDHGK